MGTSQRHNPTVSGQPNWGKSSLGLTSAIKSLERLDGIEEEIEKLLEKLKEEQNEEQPDSEDPDKNKVKVKLNKLENRKTRTTRSYERNVHKSVRHLIRASGGKNRVSSGSQRSFGHSGLTVLGNVLQAFSEIHKNGLKAWIESKGESLTGKTWEDIRDLLYDACSEKVIGLDETAADQALNELLDDLSKIVEEAENLEDVLEKTLSDAQIKEIIDKFFGVYIFAHLSQNFEEKLEKKYDQKTVARYMKDIKNQIISDVREDVNGHDASNVDWNGEEGLDFMRREFKDIINAYDDED